MPINAKKVDSAPRQHPQKMNPQKKGLILIHAGDGKGKSTAAFGTAVRAIGRGYRVAIVQFIKGKWKTGEELFFKNLKGSCDFYAMGEGFTWDTQNYDQDVKTAQQAWNKCCQVLHDPQVDLVIFDEILYAIQYNFLNAKEVVKALKHKPEDKHVILTGGKAPKVLVELADLYTLMKCRKHPYQKGIIAQPGIEY